MDGYIARSHFYAIFGFCAWMALLAAMCLAISRSLRLEQETGRRNFVGIWTVPLALVALTLMNFVQAWYLVGSLQRAVTGAYVRMWLAALLTLAWSVGTTVWLERRRSRAERAGTRASRLSALQIACMSAGPFGIIVVLGFWMWGWAK